MMFFALILLAELTSGKIYDRCELARELKFVHEAPSHQVATWVCIAEHESAYNTSIVGHLNGDGSGDHGIFQISDKFWCSPPGKGYACGVTCAELEDDNIADDFLCAQQIYKEHKDLSGDGFNAWAVYGPHCKGPKSERYVKGCFDDSEGTNEVVSDRQEPLFAHRFFGRVNKGLSTSSQTPTFDAFFTPTVSTATSYFTPSVSTTDFLTPSVSTTDFLTPSVSTTDFFGTTASRTTAFVPATRRPAIIFQPDPSTFVPFPGRSSIFSSSRTFPSSPTTSFFTSTTSTTPSDASRKPIFIINGVKWY